MDDLKAFRLNWSSTGRILVDTCLLRELDPAAHHA